MSGPGILSRGVGFLAKSWSSSSKVATTTASSLLHSVSSSVVNTLTPSAKQDYKLNFPHVAEHSKGFFNVNWETLESHNIVFDIAGEKYSTSCKQHLTPALEWVHFISDCREINENVSNLEEATKYLEGYHLQSGLARKTGEEHSHCIRLIVNEFWKKGCYQELFCLLSLGYINQLGIRAFTRDREQNYVLDVENCKKWLFQYLPDSDQSNFNPVQLDSSKLSIDMESEGTSCSVLYDEKDAQPHEVALNGVRVPWAVASQINYLTINLSTQARDFFGYFINIREEFSIIKTPFFDKKITVGDFDGCFGRMLLAAIIAGHIVLNKLELNKLACVLEKEYKAFREDEVSFTERFKQLQSDKELEQLIKEIAPNIIYLSRARQKLIFLGDGEMDRGGIAVDDFIEVKLKLKGMNPTKVVDIRGNHDAKNHVNFILVTTIGGLLSGQIGRENFDYICACYGAFAHAQRDGKSVAVCLETAEYAAFKEQCECYSDYANIEFNGENEIRIVREDGNIIFNFKAATREERLNEATKVNAHYDNGKIYIHNGLSISSAANIEGDIQLVPIDSAFGRIVNGSLQSPPEPVAKSNEKNLLYKGGYKGTDNLEKQFEVISIDENTEPPQIRTFVQNLNESFMEDYMPSSTPTSGGENAVIEGGEKVTGEIEDDFCIVEGSRNPKKREAATYMEKLVEILNKAPVPQVDFGSFRPQKVDITTLSAKMCSIVYGHDGPHNIEQITQSAARRQVYSLNPRTERFIKDNSGNLVRQGIYQPTVVALD
ncbi:MAG: hypothetical protein KBD64_06130 [Gammaproteobacteria bacterium]|nr:hypothetical protein [Gammaproteobacteria bacterium]